MTDFSKRCDILSDLWMNYRHDENFRDFVEYNDLGLPIAHNAAQGLAEPTAEGEMYVNETFDLLLEALGREDSDYDSLDDLLDGEGNDEDVA